MNLKEINIKESIFSEEHHQHSVKDSLFTGIINFFKWWLGFTGLIAGTSVCPFCGQPGCPTGAGFAAAIGGFFAIFMQNWKKLFKRL